MFLGGLFIAMASIPGWTSITIPAGWAAMSLFLPWTLWRAGRWSALHSFFILFLCLVVLSLIWAPNAFDGGFRLWQLVLLFLAFHLGSTLHNLDDLIYGLAWGCAISSCVAVAQWFGFPLVMQANNTAPSGLLYNPIVHGQTLALMAVACLCFRYWRLAAFMLPGILLSGSRGALLALAIGVTSIILPKPRLLILALLATLVVTTASQYGNDIERQLIWASAILHLTWLGQGAGSFLSMWLNNSRLVQPEYAHNDLLHLLFEFGLFALPLLWVWGSVLARPWTCEWPILAAFTFISFFAYPLFSPISAFLFMVCAGHVAVNLSRPWVSLADRRPSLLPCLAPERSCWARLRRAALPA